MDTRSGKSIAGGRFTEMSEWFASPLGRRLLDVENQLLERALSRRFGYHLLELGCADLRMHQSSPIGHKFSFAPAGSGTCHEAVAKGEAIPLSSESVDLVLLHHALDFSENQHQLLREASRILIAGGNMIIVGFNPFSAWGLRGKLRRRREPRAPWHGRMLSPLRLTDWLKLLDFQIEQVRYGVYALPINSPGMVRWSSILDKPAMRLNWPTGGIYMITARKQVAPLTPIQASWRKFPAAVGLPVTEKIPHHAAREGNEEKLCRTR